jgi:hypothetical protein
MTNFYDRHVLPRLIGYACGAGPIRRQRAKGVPGMHHRKDIGPGPWTR